MHRTASRTGDRAQGRRAGEAGSDGERRGPATGDRCLHPMFRAPGTARAWLKPPGPANRSRMIRLRRLARNFPVPARLRHGRPGENSPRPYRSSSSAPIRASGGCLGAADPAAVTWPIGARASGYRERCRNACPSSRPAARRHSPVRNTLPMSSRTSPISQPITIRRAVARDAKRLTRLVRGSGAYEGKYAAAVAGYRVGPDYIEAHRTFVAVAADERVLGFYSLVLAPPAFRRRRSARTGYWTAARGAHAVRGPCRRARPTQGRVASSRRGLLPPCWCGADRDRVREPTRRAVGPSRIRVSHSFGMTRCDARFRLCTPARCAASRETGADPVLSTARAARHLPMAHHAECVATPTCRGGC